VTHRPHEQALLVESLAEQLCAFFVAFLLRVFGPCTPNFVDVSALAPQINPLKDQFFVSLPLRVSVTLRLLCSQQITLSSSFPSKLRSWHSAQCFPRV
jgi:hypothetical protein